MAVYQEILRPSGVNPATFPTAPTFDTLIPWQKGAAQVAVFNENKVLVGKYTTETFGNWYASYSIGRLPFDAAPPPPPTQRVAQVTVTTFDNGGGQVVWESVEDPERVPVCEIPSFPRLPPPQGGRGSIVSRPPDGTVTLTLVKVGETTKSPDGFSTWVRIL